MSGTGRRGVVAPGTIGLSAGVIALLAWHAGAPQARAQGTPIVQCAAEITTLVTTSGPGKKLGATLGTGTLVTHNNAYFLLTAYHVLSEKDQVTVRFPREDGTQGPPAYLRPAGGPRDFETDLYLVPALDIAVARLLPATAERLGLRSAEGGVRAITIAGTPPARGTAAIAVGNPLVRIGKDSELQFQAQNIVYGCTVSEYRLPLQRIGGFIDADARQQLSERERERLDGEPMMFLETFSIKEGFSGGPVIRSPDNSYADGELVGIVIGGVRSDVQLSSGRFAFAIGPRLLREIIENYAQALGGSTAPGIGRKEPFPPPGGWPRPTFKAAYNLQDTRIIDSQALIDNQWTRQEILNNAENHRLIFRGIRFIGTNFDRAYLAAARFEDCLFDQVSFAGSVLTGATFVNCTFGYCASEPLLYAGVVAINDELPSGMAPAFGFASPAAALGPVAAAEAPGVPAPGEAAMMAPPPAPPMIDLEFGEEPALMDTLTLPFPDLFPAPAPVPVPDLAPAPPAP